ncbi:mitochondrial 50S ribosomal protein L3 [Vararia minispora EC-137]|uniref:Mitochondrial 50S ribosomal protein L3 n=1 Tax=Vararia minispora EC-137 TaxID=1314806 RepID=A0ACB8QGH8_9AGAM|nr:mitochondrial 50S ribosomal protein L3 [Vararia minispora EC-137]
MAQSPCRHIHFSSPVSAKAVSEPPSTEPAPESKWTPYSVRTGVLARKRGMTAMWDSQGMRIPVTVFQLENCQVTANVKFVRPDKTEYHAVQVAGTDKREKSTTAQMRGHFQRAGVQPKQVVKEFPITPDAHVPVGTTLSAAHFVPGQFVDVVANSIGKGFQGGMKKHGFKGLRASHGVSISHRSIGSTGGHQDPGRVWPGQKMPGRMGNKRRTAQNLYVVRIDTELDLIFVKGCAPGVDDAHVMIRDAKKKLVQMAATNHAKGLFEKVLPRGLVDLPFPAGTKELAATLPRLIEAPSSRVSDPFFPVA